jgi:hypothetical protein
MVDAQSFLFSFNTPFLGSRDLLMDGIRLSRYHDSGSESSSDEDSDDQSVSKSRPNRRRKAPLAVLRGSAGMGNRGCECDECMNQEVMVKQTRYRDYDEVDPNGDPPNRDHFFSLCDRVVGAFALKERAFGKSFCQKVGA